MAARKRNRNRNRNRKNTRTRKTSQRKVFPGFLALILFLATGASLGYLYVCGRCDALGKNINSLEKKRDAVKRDVVNEQFKWSNMTAPENIERLLARHNLQMIQPTEDMVVRLRRGETHRQYAFNSGNRMHD